MFGLKVFNSAACKIHFLPLLSHKSQSIACRISPFFLRRTLHPSFSRTGLLAKSSHRNFSTVGQEKLSAVDKPLAFWLIGVSIAVFGMVVVGGVTRLTRSGLSMVDWNFQGRRLPRTTEEWQAEFDKYKKYPEFQRRNSQMTLEEFKSIYFLEWFHRMWGRALGIVYGVPAIYFIVTRKSFSTRLKLFGLLTLGGAQGLVGWWMVKSGLDENMPKWKDPRVSAYRLAAHLFMAMCLYSGLLWTAFTALSPNKVILDFTPWKKLKRVSLLTLAFAGTTFISGAFVAGNDAGLAYNDWPFYAGNFVPEEVIKFYSNLGENMETLKTSSIDFGYAAFFENTGMVQFNHRNLAYCTFALSLATFLLSKRFKRLSLPSSHQITKSFQNTVSFAGHLVVAVASIQVTLGISTLLLIVPVPLASLHQAGAISLWTTLLYLNFVLRRF